MKAAEMNSDFSQPTSPTEIKIETAEPAPHVFSPNTLVEAAIKTGFAELCGPVCESELPEGGDAFRYMTDQVTLALSRRQIVRLVTFDLKPSEYFTLRRHHGVFFEIHEDFYDADTGEALQPVR